jgi:hypothetical protein
MYVIDLRLIGSVPLQIEIEERKMQLAERQSANRRALAELKN